MTKACIVGDPVAHSRSPMVHGYWLKQYGIAGEYLREHVTPDQFPEFLQGLKNRGYAGCNITIPHKEAALALIDEIDDTARAIGALNTVVVEGDRLIGFNTDISGFIDNLDWRAPQWDVSCEQALVIGAGGGARGIVYGLIQRGVQNITVVNRSRDRAEALFADFAYKGLRVADFDELPKLAPTADLVINTTSLGMKGQPPLPLDLTRLKDSAVVSDIVYVPLDTPLLIAAKARGLRTVDGLGMLLFQAVPGFTRWFGQKPEVTQALFDHVAADIRAGG
jgi:shikimate dehydrogenase